VKVPDAVYAETIVQHGIRIVPHLAVAHTQPAVPAPTMTELVSIMSLKRELPVMSRPYRTGGCDAESTDGFWNRQPSTKK
jgi:hypothetical protein